VSADDYGGPVHVGEACAYCPGDSSTHPARSAFDPWEWYACGTFGSYGARFVWSGVVRDVAREYGVLAHPVSPEGAFYCGGPSDLAKTCDYVALPLCYEEALRHVQYEEDPLRQLFKALEDPAPRAAAGAAWSLGGTFALRDYLRGIGAL
jgi:hypothetical protein